MLGAAVVAIPLTGTIVASNTHLNAILGIILAFGLFFLLASIIAGIKQMDVTSRFFNEYAQHNANRAKALFGSRNLTLDKALEQADIANIRNKLKGESNMTYSIIQGWCLGLGLLLISGVIIFSIYIHH